MKDFVSRLTFGFLMGQLFPGAVAVFATTFAYRTYKGSRLISGCTSADTFPSSVLSGVELIVNDWNDAKPAQLVFLFALCVGFGMFIHGVHWSVLGALEQIAMRKSPPGAMFDDDTHNRPIWFQFVIAPYTLVRELCVLFSRPDTAHTAIEENVAGINEHWTKQHEFMQDFYLYPAQFFAHSAYAIALCELALIWYVIVQHRVTCHRVVLLFILYFAICSFFTIARIQLFTLFQAERVMLRICRTSPP